MDCQIPLGYETVMWEGEEIQASTSGRGEVEVIDGEDVYVQYHGLMKRFEPQVAPPRPKMNWGCVSGMARAFMRGDRREFAELVHKSMVEPVEFEGGAAARNFTHSRNQVQRAVLNYLHLASIVDNGKTVAGQPYEGLILVNPSVSAVKILTEQYADFDVIFRPDQEEQDDELNERHYLAYVAKMRVALSTFDWDGEELGSDFQEPGYLYYCGFNCTGWERYADSFTIELSPSAYKATGRSFHMIEETDEAITYVNHVYSKSIRRAIVGKYSKKCPLYRYTPDQLERYFRSSTNVTCWGMHGVLSTIRVHEWGTAVRQVPVVKGACMIGARALPVTTSAEAVDFVSKFEGQTVAQISELCKDVEYLRTDIGTYNVTRFYIFDHLRMVLDTGVREYLKQDPGGQVRFMGSNYSESTRERADLVLRRDTRGQFKYKNLSYIVVWHSTMSYMSKQGKTMVMMPQTSVVRYTAGAPMFANDKMYDEDHDGSYDA